MARVKRGVTAHAKHKKFLNRLKVFTVVVKIPSVQLRRRLIVQSSMLIVIVKIGNVLSVLYGFRESMQLSVQKV